MKEELIMWPQEVMSIKKLKQAFAPYNPRVELAPGMREWDELVKSIKKHGFVDYGIVYNKRTNVLVGGHQRVKVLDEVFHVKEVQVTIVDVDELEERTMNVALNKVEGIWDLPKLQELFDEIKDIDESALEFTGYSSEEVNKLLDEAFPDDKMPKDFKEYDEDTPSKFRCPACGHEWNGKPRPE